MKKTFNFKVLIAVVFTAFSLTSCSEELVGNESEKSREDLSSLTVFSSGEPANNRVFLKTSIDEQGAFYWTAGDRIFVKNGDNYVKSTDEVSSKVTNAKFHVGGTYTAPEYPVVYTGNGPDTQANQVTIKSEQTQMLPNDATHIGTDGDCGNAMATKNGVLYNFDLNHRASYLVLAPRHAMKNDVKLQKVEVTTSGSDNLCGTYTFSENTMSLKDETVTSAGKTVTLNIDSWLVPSIDPFPFSADAFDGIRSFIVIQPGTHTLTFKYYVTVAGVPRTITKEVASREFVAGAYTKVNHVLTDAPNTMNFRNGFVYAQWGSANEYLPYKGNNDYNSTIVGLMPFTAPWSELPNINELYWYIINGDPRWDKTTKWSVDGGKTTYTGGVWIMKKSAILAAGREFSSSVGKDYEDMRVVYKTQFVDSNRYQSAGKPSASEIDKYFFLPAMGLYLNGQLNYLAVSGHYWPSTPGKDPHKSYVLIFTSTNIRLNYGSQRFNGFVVAPGWFK